MKVQENSSFATLIEKDRAEASAQVWSGNFLDYLELVKADPSVAKLAHALAHTRVYDVIVDAGFDSDE